MKLFYTPTSPYVRKVLVCAHELGLFDRLALELLRPSPLAPNETLSRANPLSKIPALVADDDTTLFDSPVICEYLDALSGDAGGPRVIPVSGPARWAALRLEALADGALDAAVQVFYERQHRPPERQWPEWMEAQTKKVRQALDAIDGEVDGWGDTFHIGHITVAAALGWFTFRDVIGDWRTPRPRLAAWLERVSARPSLAATAPH